LKKPYASAHAKVVNSKVGMQVVDGRDIPVERLQETPHRGRRPTEASLQHDSLICLTRDAMNRAILDAGAQSAFLEAARKALGLTWDEVAP